MEREGSRSGVPTMLNMLANHPGAGISTLSSLKCIVYGASPMPEGVLRKALQVFPNCQFVHGYGMTEAAPLLTLLPPRYTTSKVHTPAASSLAAKPRIPLR